MRKMITLLLLFCFVFSGYTNVTIVQPDLTEQDSFTYGVTNYLNDANCVGAWYMNSSSTETDRSGNGVTLTESGGDDIPTSGDVPSGYGGGSRLWQESAVEYLIEDADGSSLDINGSEVSMTICFWAKVTSIANAEYDNVVSKYDNADDNAQYIYYFRGNGVNTFTQRFQVDPTGDGSADGSSYGSTTMNAGTWYHVASVYSYSLGTIQSYVNGAVDGSATSYNSGIYNGNEKFQVGLARLITNPWDGEMDELIIFDRALSVEEINDIMLNGIDNAKGEND